MGLRRPSREKWPRAYKTLADDAFHRALLDCVPNFAVAFDRSTRVRSVNRALGKFVDAGLSGPIRPGQPFLNKTSVERAPDVVAAVDAVFHGKSITLVRPYESRQLELRFQPIFRGKIIVGGLLLIRDVTAKRVAESSARDAVARYRAMFEAMPDPIMILDRALRIVELKSTYDVPMVAPSAELANRRLRDLPPPISTLLADLAERAFATKAIEHGEYEIVIDGKPRSREAWVRAFAPNGAILIFRDVTEHRNVLSRLLVTERMASIGTLAAGVAHELNNPLAFVSANLRFVAEELAACPMEDVRRSAEARSAIEEALDGAERMRVIVRDLRTFSRSDDDSDELVDVQRTLDIAVNMASLEIQQRGTLVRDYHATAHVRIAEARLGQVVLNLLVNAAHALDPGTPLRNVIRVRTGNAPDGRVAIEVADNGSGIPLANRQRVFDPFFTTKPQGEGTGLGLSICQGIVTAAGGELQLESVEGEGSIFRVLLPAVHEPDLVLPRPQPSERLSFGSIPVGRAHILVVDDDGPLGAALLKMLREHEVKLVQDAESALVELAKGTYDLVLCDVMMPGVSGIDLYELARTRWPGLEQTIVLMTGGVFTDRAREFFRKNDVPVLEKPFTREHVRKLLDNVRAHA